MTIGVAIGLAIGAIVGVIVGIIAKDLALWLSIGIGSGIAIGVGIGGLLECKSNNDKPNRLIYLKTKKMENTNLQNKDYQCPVCGAPIAYDSAMCSVCKVGISWNDGKPLSAIKGKTAKTFWIITIVLLSLVAFGLLFYVLQ